MGPLETWGYVGDQSILGLQSGARGSYGRREGKGDGKRSWEKGGQPWLPGQAYPFLFLASCNSSFRHLYYHYAHFTEGNCSTARVRTLGNAEAALLSPLIQRLLTPFAFFSCVLQS